MDELNRPGSIFEPRYWLADPWAHLIAFERAFYGQVYSRNPQMWGGGWSDRWEVIGG